MTNPCTILGINISTLSSDEVMKCVHHFIDSGKPHQIATVNTEFIMAAQIDKQFAETLNSSDITLADGAGVVLAAKLLKQTVPERITGVDLTQKLAAEAAKKGYRMFLLGGRHGVGQKAAETLSALNPGLQIVGTYEGSPDDSSIIPLIHHSNPHILLVAWGAPKQDVWINQHKDELGVPVMMGVGGTFDFIAGKQKRAPVWMQSAGLEWLWRLGREPRRWRRQLALPKMFLIIFWQKLTNQK